MSSVRPALLSAVVMFTGIYGFAPISIVRGEATYEGGVEYSNPDDQHLQLNIACPDGDGPFPAVVCIHGGGFREGDLSYYDGLIQTLAERGYVAVTINYRFGAHSIRSPRPFKIARPPFAGCARTRKSITLPHIVLEWWVAQRVAISPNFWGRRRIRNNSRARVKT